MAKNPKTSVWAAVALAATLALTGAGCNKSAEPTTGAPQSVPPAGVAPVQSAPAAEIPPAAEPAPTVAGTGDCNHPYYPLKKGYRIAYRVTAPTSTVNYAWQVDAADSGSADLSFVFDQPAGLTTKQKILCSGGSLRTDGFLNLANAYGGAKVDMQTDKVEGDIVPRDMKIGTEWTTKYVVKMKIQAAGVPAGYGSVSSSIEQYNKVIAEEPVTVPAGTFTALKVEQNTTTTTSMPGLPVQQPPTKSTTYEWWVKGVGMVKMTTADGSETAATQITLP